MKRANYKSSKLVHSLVVLWVGIMIAAFLIAWNLIKAPTVASKLFPVLIFPSAIFLLRKKNLLITLLLILPFFRFRFQLFGVEAELHELLLVVLFAHTLVTGIINRELYSVNWLFILYVGALLFSSILNNVSPFEFKGTYLHAVAFPFMIYFVLINVRSLESIKQYIFPLLAISSLISFIFAAIFSSSAGFRLLPISSNNPLYLGQLYAYLQMLTILFGIPLYFSKITEKRFLLFIPFFVAMTALIFSGTRSVLASTILTGFFELRLVGKLKRGVIFVGIILLLSVLSPSNVRIPFLHIPVNIISIVTRGSGNIDHVITQQRRRPYWIMALSIIKEKPLLGHGLIEYGKLSSSSYLWYFMTYVNLLGDENRLHKQTEDFPHPHQLYLLLMVSGGIVALIIFLLFLIDLFRKGFKAYHRSCELRLDSLLIAALCSLFAFLMCGFVSIPFFSGGQYNFIIWFLIGLIERIYRDTLFRQE